MLGSEKISVVEFHCKIELIYKLNHMLMVKAFFFLLYSILELQLYYVLKYSLLSYNKVYR